MSDSRRGKICKLKGKWLAERLRDYVSALQVAEEMRVIQSGTKG